MIVPGSILNVNHLYGWYVYVREKTGARKEHTYWHHCSEANTPELVAAYINEKFHNVDVLRVEACTKPPGQILKPVPAKHFQYGLLHPDDPDPQEKNKPIQPLWKPGQPLPKFPPLPPRRSLWQQHR